MISRRTVLSGLALSAGAAACAEAGAPGGFVRVEDGRFLLDGRPYRYAGTNLWYGAYLGSSGGNRDRLKHELDTLHGLGLDNLRVLGAAELSPLKNSLNPAFRGETPPYNEDLLGGLDFLLAEMGRRGMKAVIYLNNFWEWSGGMVTYLYWTNGGHYIDLNDPAHPWPEFADFSAQFYASPKALALYEQYVAALVDRTNTVTGKKYRSDRTIMSWQLANEPRPGGSLAKAQFKPMNAWIARTAKFIKARDPNHLISTGNEGLKGCLESEDCVVGAHAPAAIDYLTFHLWPLNWGWIDPKDMAGTFTSCDLKSRDYVATHLRIAGQLNKPAVLEEFGFARDGGGYGANVPTTYRDRFYAMVFSALEESTMSGGPFAGTNFWAWGGAGRAQHADFLVRAGDTSFVGDPPQEPQGRNSVFDSDTSTLKLIGAHTARLKTLGGA
jgi:mannan endo-1,4-beta-mannosidase